MWQRAKNKAANARKAVSAAGERAAAAAEELPSSRRSTFKLSSSSTDTAQLDARLGSLYDLDDWTNTTDGVAMSALAREREAERTRDPFTKADDARRAASQATALLHALRGEVAASSSEERFVQRMRVVEAERDAEAKRQAADTAAAAAEAAEAEAAAAAVEGGDDGEPVSPGSGSLNRASSHRNSLGSEDTYGGNYVGIVRPDTKVRPTREDCPANIRKPSSSTPE